MHLWLQPSAGRHGLSGKDVTVVLPTDHELASWAPHGCDALLQICSLEGGGQFLWTACENLQDFVERADHHLLCRSSQCPEVQQGRPQPHQVPEQARTIWQKCCHCHCQTTLQHPEHTGNDRPGAGPVHAAEGGLHFQQPLCWHANVLLVVHVPGRGPVNPDFGGEHASLGSPCHTIQPVQPGCPAPVAILQSATTSGATTFAATTPAANNSTTLSAATYVPGTGLPAGLPWTVFIPRHHNIHRGPHLRASNRRLTVSRHHSRNIRMLHMDLRPHTLRHRLSMGSTLPSTSNSILINSSSSMAVSMGISSRSSSSRSSSSNSHMPRVDSHMPVTAIRTMSRLRHKRQPIHHPISHTHHSSREEACFVVVLTLCELRCWSGWTKEFNREWIEVWYVPVWLPCNFSGVSGCWKWFGVKWYFCRTQVWCLKGKQWKRCWCAGSVPGNLFKKNHPSLKRISGSFVLVCFTFCCIRDTPFVSLTTLSVVSFHFTFYLIPVVLFHFTFYVTHHMPSTSLCSYPSSPLQVHFLPYPP